MKSLHHQRADASEMVNHQVLMTLNLIVDLLYA